MTPSCCHFQRHRQLCQTFLVPERCKLFRKSRLPLSLLTSSNRNLRSESNDYAWKQPVVGFCTGFCTRLKRKGFLIQLLIHKPKEAGLGARPHILLCVECSTTYVTIVKLPLLKTLGPDNQEGKVRNESRSCLQSEVLEPQQHAYAHEIYRCDRLSGYSRKLVGRAVKLMYLYNEDLHALSSAHNILERKYGILLFPDKYSQHSSKMPGCADLPVSLHESVRLALCIFLSAHA